MSETLRQLPQPQGYDPLLMEMLTYGRPHNTLPEINFIRKFIRPAGAKYDFYGNLVMTVGKNPIIMWSCHTDTVHHTPIFPQSVRAQNGIVTLKKRKYGRVLGADDTAGVWLMLEMIKARKPGLYVFHRGEECGGLGSAWRAKNVPNDLAGIKCAIALDRKGHGDVITHQSVGRCCSDTFGASLADQLGGAYDLDDTGTFTDTANYVDLVGECTNISVGYHHAHTSSEELDVWFLQRLRGRLLNLNPEKLIFKRKPGEKEARTYNRNRYSGYYSQGGSYHSSQPDAAGEAYHKYYGSSYNQGSWYDEDEFGSAGNQPADSRAREFARLVEKYPEVAASTLDELGITLEDFIDMLKLAGYTQP